GRIPVIVVQRRGGDPFAGRSDKNRGAGGAERSDMAVLLRGSGRDHKAAVGETVVVGIVTVVGGRGRQVLSVVAGGRTVDRAEAVASLGYAGLDRILHHRPCGIEKIVGELGRVSPAVVRNVDVHLARQQVGQFGAQGTAEAEARVVAHQRGVGSNADRS